MIRKSMMPYLSLICYVKSDDEIMINKKREFKSESSAFRSRTVSRSETLVRQLDSPPHPIQILPSLPDSYRYRT